ncbi:acyltransferase [Nitrogeniibacter mangrovi]|uniref:Acyltransferase n=1 Tax=Nitrogeniibacter mangrovi TaxID=2016596 RepID=A0A6C1B867_9RHOO|nr:acyltransferase [Nitrogeniibacter mangrovi]QID18530.1 acyltransferase [Nitrogeniibacter mangrovi]
MKCTLFAWESHLFGVYRTLLALAVLFQHLADIPLIGHFAVYGFFVLSGYLMTTIMHQTYGYTTRGRLAYFLNRFLRLFPTYWIICLLTLGLIVLQGEPLTRSYHDAIYVPTRGVDILANLSLIFPALSPKWVEPRLAPPTWALTLELIHYVLIALGVSRSRRITWLWLAVAASYFAATYALGLGHESRYSYLPAASLPFSIGALLFHYRDATREFVARIPGHPLVWLLAVVPLALTAQLDHRAYIEPLFFMNMALHALIIAKLRDWPRGGWLGQSDKRIGDLSYPMYLGHYLAGLSVSLVLWGAPVHGATPQGVISALVAAVVVSCLAYAINVTVDRNIERARQALKKRARPIAPASA